MDEKHFQELLGKYLNGTATEEETAQVRRFESHFLSDETSVFESEQEREQVRAELYQRVKPKSQSNMDWRGLAAGVVLLVGFAVAGWWLNGEMSPAYQVVLQTGTGEQTSIELGDGTKVFLNAESVLEMHSDYDDGKGERLMRLRGEGYFQVAKNVSRPFVVESGGVEVRVLGTEFNLRAYQVDSVVSVSLVEGKVNAKGLGEEQILDPNQEMNFDLRTQEAEVVPFDADEVTAWRSGTLVLDRTSLGDWAQIMKRQFGTEIRFEDEAMKKQTITGSFDQPMELVVIYAVTAAKGWSYEQQPDQSIVIYQSK